MLTGVLLHVIESAGPVDRPINRPARQRHVEAVGDPLALVHDIEHSGRAEPAGIVRLPA